MHRVSDNKMVLLMQDIKSDVTTFYFKYTVNFQMLNNILIVFCFVLKQIAFIITCMFRRIWKYGTELNTSM